MKLLRIGKFNLLGCKKIGIMRCQNPVMKTNQTKWLNQSLNVL